MNADIGWCHNCDEPVADMADFYAHANAGHAVTDRRCRGRCQFREAS